MKTRIAIVSATLSAAVLSTISLADGPATRPTTAPVVTLPLSLPHPVTRPTTAPVAVASTRPAVVPFELMPSGHIAVMARFNGRGPYRFVFDTGAPSLLVGERVAKLSGVLPPKFRRPFFSIMGNLGEHKATSVDVGGGRLDGPMVEVWNHPTVDLLARAEGPLEGIIGFPFFARFRTTIDYRARTLTFAPSTFRPVDTQARLTASMEGGDPVIAPAATLGVRLAKDARDPAPGVVVTDVSANGPAAEAGLLIGDRVLTLDGRWTDAVPDAYTAVADVDPDAKAMPVTLSRDGRKMTLSIAVRQGI